MRKRVGHDTDENMFLRYFIFASVHLRHGFPLSREGLWFYSYIKLVSSSSLVLFLLPAKALHVSGVLEMSSREPMDRECSAEGLLRGGGKGEISVSLVS